MNGFRNDLAVDNNDVDSSVLYKIRTLVAASIANAIVSAKRIPIG